MSRHVRELYADEQGAIYDHPTSSAFGWSGHLPVPLLPGELIPLPEGGMISSLPGRAPLLLPRSHLTRSDGKTCGKSARVAVAAVLPPGYTRLLLPAYSEEQHSPPLPLLGYTACGWYWGKIRVAALSTQISERWDPSRYNAPDLQKRIQETLASHQGNRILAHLARCATSYGCYTAQNIFYGRWEGGLPVSSGCNARCEGCISAPPSCQQRLAFRPSLEEAVEVGTLHLEQGEDPMISFGQGCEGEPLLLGGELEIIIRKIRKKTGRGIVHLNTNGSLPEAVRRLVSAGLDSIRVSLNSAQEKWYNRYYKPGKYTLSDVRETLKITRFHGVFTSLNLLVFPGVTDDQRETEAMLSLLRETQPHMIQLRNLNIDPARYLSRVIQHPVKGIGILPYIHTLKRDFPSLLIGSVTPHIGRGPLPQILSK